MGGGAEVQVRLFLTSAPDGGKWITPRPGRLNPAEINASVQGMGGWVRPRDGVQVLAKRKSLVLPVVKTWILHAVNYLLFSSTGSMVHAGACPPS